MIYKNMMTIIILKDKVKWNNTRYLTINHNRE